MPIRIEVFGRPFRWMLQRAVAGFARARVPASVLTFTSFGLCVVAGVLFGTGRFFSAGVAMVPAAACDLVARPLSHRQARVDFFHAFLKSVLHRYADLAVFLGLLVYYSTVNRFLYALLTGFVMAGAVMVSYSQARAESLIDRCRVGFWERPQRLGLLIIGTLLNWLPAALRPSSPSLTTACSAISGCPEARSKPGCAGLGSSGGPLHRETHYFGSPVFLSKGSLTREAASG